MAPKTRKKINKSKTEIAVIKIFGVNIGLAVLNNRAEFGDAPIINDGAKKKNRFRELEISSKSDARYI